MADPQTTAVGRRTKRRYAHELYPHADEWQTRPLAVEVPYLYSRMIGFSLLETGWHKAAPGVAGTRASEYLAAARTALLADALAQGMTGDEAWEWADHRVTEDMEVAYERAAHYGVDVDAIKPYPCGPDPDPHRHLVPTVAPNGYAFTAVERVPGREDDCPDCTEPTPETETR